MKIITEEITFEEVKRMAVDLFGDMVKAVVDVDRECLAMDAELHADLEALLLQEGSRRQSLWGINLYPDLPGEDFVEYNSLINVRPSQGNRSRGVEDVRIRDRIVQVVGKRVRR